MTNDSVKGILLNAVHAASGESRLIDDLELTELCLKEQLLEEVPDRIETTAEAGGDIEITNGFIRETLMQMDSCGQAPLTVMKGKERLRCYDPALISTSYAQALNLTAEGYSLETIAETVRKESRLYPRPCLTRVFQGEPYNLDRKELETAVEALVLDNSEFADILRAAASNGDVYLFSDRYMNRSRAEYLAEWESVGSMECQ